MLKLVGMKSFTAQLGRSRRKPIAIFMLLAVVGSHIGPAAAASGASSTAVGSFDEVAQAAGFLQNQVGESIGMVGIDAFRGSAINDELAQATISVRVVLCTFDTGCALRRVDGVSFEVTTSGAHLVATDPFLGDLSIDWTFLGGPGFYNCRWTWTGSTSPWGIHLISDLIAPTMPLNQNAGIRLATATGKIGSFDMVWSAPFENGIAGIAALGRETIEWFGEGTDPAPTLGRTPSSCG